MNSLRATVCGTAEPHKLAKRGSTLRPAANYPTNAEPLVCPGTDSGSGPRIFDVSAGADASGFREMVHAGFAEVGKTLKPTTSTQQRRCRTTSGIGLTRGVSWNSPSANHFVPDVTTSCILIGGENLSATEPTSHIHAVVVGAMLAARRIESIGRNGLIRGEGLPAQVLLFKSANAICRSKSSGHPLARGPFAGPCSNFCRVARRLEVAVAAACPQVSILWSISFNANYPPALPGRARSVRRSVNH